MYVPHNLKAWIGTILYTSHLVFNIQKQQNFFLNILFLKGTSGLNMKTIYLNQLQMTI